MALGRRLGVLRPFRRVSAFCTPHISLSCLICAEWYSVLSASLSASVLAGAFWCPAVPADSLGPSGPRRGPVGSFRSGAGRRRSSGDALAVRRACPVGSVAGGSATVAGLRRSPRLGVAGRRWRPSRSCRVGSTTPARLGGWFWLRRRCGSGGCRSCVYVRCAGRGVQRAVWRERAEGLSSP